ncbi:MAG TPA: hypothetical protein VJ868_08205 [Actinomycetota bacterium]|jgi:hypothetical protein|nr:hypothetical protein [Actinomycetota bacterium]
MTFAWRYLGPDGEGRGTSEPFPDRAAAETWMGEAWSDLRARGIEEVILEEDGREGYRMGLGEA